MHRRVVLAESTLSGPLGLVANPTNSPHTSHSEPFRVTQNHSEAFGAIPERSSDTLTPERLNRAFGVGITCKACQETSNSIPALLCDQYPKMCVRILILVGRSLISIRFLKLNSDSKMKSRACYRLTALLGRFSNDSQTAPK